MASDNKQIRRKIYRGTGDDEINFIWSEIKKWVMEDRWGGGVSVALQEVENAVICCGAVS